MHTSNMRFREIEKHKLQNEDNNSIDTNTNQLDQLIVTIKKNCSDFLPLIEEDRPLLRRMTVELNPQGWGVVDPSSRGRRTSISNPGMTVVNDILGETRPDIPRRDRSLFFTFGPTEKAYGPFQYAVIPFNRNRFGSTEEADWISERLQGKNPLSSHIANGLRFNTVYRYGTNFILPLLEKWGEDGLRTEPATSETLNEMGLGGYGIQKYLESIGYTITDDPHTTVGTIWDVLCEGFDPKVNVHRRSELLSLGENHVGEIWTDGPVVMIDSDLWNTLRKAIYEIQ